MRIIGNVTLTTRSKAGERAYHPPGEPAPGGARAAADAGASGGDGG